MQANKGQTKGTSAPGITSFHPNTKAMSDTEESWVATELPLERKILQGCKDKLVSPLTTTRESCSEFSR